MDLSSALNTIHQQAFACTLKTTKRLNSFEVCLCGLFVSSFVYYKLLNVALVIFDSDHFNRFVLQRRVPRLLRFSLLFFRCGVISLNLLRLAVDLTGNASRIVVRERGVVARYLPLLGATVRYSNRFQPSMVQFNCIKPNSNKYSNFKQSWRIVCVPLIYL